MNIWRRLFYRLMSRLEPDLKRDYRLVRRIKSVLSPVLPVYHFMDYRILSGRREVPVRIFSPGVSRGSDILLFFHGGGWVTGNIDTYTGVCQTMAERTGCPVVSVDYRLAPEHPFPKGLDDCYRVFRALSEHPEMVDGQSGAVTLIGDSAGANLAAAVSLRAQMSGRPMPRRQILLYPATYNDHSPASPFPSIRENGEGYGLSAKAVQDYLTLYMGSERHRRHPLLAPLLAEDVSGQPETLIITAEYDPLRDEGAAYAEKLAAAGVPTAYFCMPDAVHGFISFPSFNGSVVKCYEVIRSFLDNVTADHSKTAVLSRVGDGGLGTEQE